MKVAFINSNTELRTVFRGGAPSVGLMEFVAILKERGAQPLYVDAFLENLEDEQLIQRLEDFEPEVIGVSCVSENRFEAMNTIRRLRQSFPESLIMAGGYQFSYYSEEALQLLPELDLIVRHEGEEALISLLEVGFDRSHFESILGITFRTADGEILSTQDAPLPADLDEYPIPDWTALPRNSVSGFGVLAARGCIGSCIFCAGARRRLRFRSPDKVLEEISMLLDIFGRERLAGGIAFNDDSLTLSPKNLVAIMEGMINNGFNLPFTARTRADAITEDLLRLMKEAGLKKIGSGIDAPSQRIMDTMGKKERIEEIVHAFEMYNRLKIKSSGHILIGYEGETMDDIMNGVRLQRKLNRLPYVNIGLSLLRIYPGTWLEEIGRQNGSLPPYFSWYRPEDMDHVETGLNVAGRTVPWFVPSTMPFSKLKWLHFSKTKLTPQYFTQIAKFIVKKKRYGLLVHPHTYRVLMSRLTDAFRH
jgi:radical SAM superfamily enzyme YgiQ (UPF0313 family)